MIKVFINIIVKFKTSEDLIKKIDFYLNNSLQREKISVHGYNTAVNNYELNILLKQIANYMQ